MAAAVTLQIARRGVLAEEVLEVVPAETLCVVQRTLTRSLVQDDVVAINKHHFRVIPDHRR